MKTWTIAVSYTANDDNGKPFQAKTVIQVEAEDMRQAYEEADRAGAGRGWKLGAILPGKHLRVL